MSACTEQGQYMQALSTHGGSEDKGESHVGGSRARKARALPKVRPKGWQGQIMLVLWRLW